MIEVFIIVRQTLVFNNLYKRISNIFDKMEYVNDMTRMSLFHNLRTGNIIFDMILSSLIAVVFTSIMRINILQYTNFDWFYCNRNVISLTCTESRNYNGKRIMDTSETFRSILWFIKQNIKQGKTDGLKKLLEYYTCEYEDNDDEEEERWRII